MRLETVRIITAWLKDDTYGVAAKLAALPLDGADSRPTTIADTSIVDETDNASAAFRRFDGLTMPALLTTATEATWRDAELPQLNERADGYVTVQVRYAERNTASQTAIVNGMYVMKAVVASLRELHLNGNAASRTRNSVYLVSCESIEEQGIYEEVDDTWLTAAVQLRYYVSTIIPLGA